MFLLFLLFTFFNEPTVHFLYEIISYIQRFLRGQLIFRQTERKVIPEIYDKTILDLIYLENCVPLCVNIRCCSSAENFYRCGIVTESTLCVECYLAVLYAVLSFLGYKKNIGKDYRNTNNTYSGRNIQRDHSCKSYNKQYHSSRSRMKLTAAAEMIGYTYNPHDALEDVKATLHVYQALQQPGQIAVKRLPEEKKPTPVRTGGARYKPNPNANPNHPLYGKTIVITGELPIDREEASLKAADLGAKVRVGISPRTQILVCGERLAEWSEQYGEKSYKIKKAEKINEEGGSIELMPGEKFMALLNQPAGEPEKVSTVDT